MGNPSRIQFHVTSVKRALLGAALLSSLLPLVGALVFTNSTSSTGRVNRTIATGIMLAADALPNSTLANIQAREANRSSQRTHFDDHFNHVRWIAWVRRAKRVRWIAAARGKHTLMSGTIHAREMHKRRGNHSHMAHFHNNHHAEGGPGYGGPSYGGNPHADAYDDSDYERAIEAEIEEELKNELGSDFDFDNEEDPDALNGYDSDDVQESNEEDPLDDHTKAAIKEEVEEELQVSEGR